MNDFDAAVIIANGLDYLNVSEDLYKKCVEANIPFVMAGHKTDEGHFIMSDNVVGTKQLIEYVVDKLGCKDIAFLAGGIAEYDPELDQCFADVFKRADSIMYQKKTAMKQ